MRFYVRDPLKINETGRPKNCRNMRRLVTLRFGALHVYLGVTKSKFKTTGTTYSGRYEQFQSLFYLFQKNDNNFLFWINFLNFSLKSIYFSSTRPHNIRVTFFLISNILNEKPTFAKFHATCI